MCLRIGLNADGVDGGNGIAVCVIQRNGEVVTHIDGADCHLDGGPAVGCPGLGVHNDGRITAAHGGLCGVGRDLGGNQQLDLDLGLHTDTVPGNHNDTGPRLGVGGVEDGSPGGGIGCIRSCAGQGLRIVLTPQSPAVEKDIDVLWVGAFNSCKCPEKLLTIAQRLSQYKFTLISKPVSPEYHDLEKSLRALPNVDFVGTVPFEQTQNYFNRAIVYLCTSAVEGFPNTFLQSWHARAAVVSVTFPCDDILTGYHAGILAGNEEKAAAVIDELLTDSALRNKLCDNAQKYLVGNHLPAAVLEKFEKLING